MALTHQRSGNPVFANLGQVTYWQGRGTHEAAAMPWSGVTRIPTSR